MEARQGIRVITRTKMVSIALAAAGGLALGVSAPAEATTFCVPAFHAACPANGTNVAQPDLETAMKANASDGIPDRVIVDGVTMTDPNYFQAAGFDDLEVVGAGPAKTRLTSSTTGTTTVLDLVFGSSREVTVRDLSVVVPATIGANSAAIASDGDTFDNVDVVAQRTGIQGISPAGGGTTFTDGALTSTGTGSIGFGFWVPTSSTHSGELRVERSLIDGAARGFVVEKPNTPLTLERVQVLDPDESALGVTGGNDVSIANSVLQSGSSSPIFLFNNSPELQKVDLENVTVDSSTGDATKPAIDGEVQSAAGTGSVDIEVDSSIIRGFDKTWELTSPAGNLSIGDTYISLRHSNFLPAGTNAGSGTTYLAPDNTEGDPKFRGPGDYRLQPGSPAIDAGDPGAAMTLDLLGQLRPADGNDDGRSVIDQGAYEYLPPAKPKPVCEINPALCPDPSPRDTTAPRISRIKFLAPTGKRAGYLKFTLSEAAKVKARFQPKPAGKGANKRRTVRISKRGRAGVNKFVIKKGKMKPGGYRLSISATDAAGNRSGPLAGRVIVKPAKR